MALQGWLVRPVPRVAVERFIEANHYSGSINGVNSTYCFALLDPDNALKGAALFGEMATTSWRAYGERESDVLELRRLCCVDDTPKNAESFLIGGCIRWLRRNTEVKILVSYADPNYGHEGTIYRATNWRYEGLTPPDKGWRWNGHTYHSRAPRVRYRGALKPFAQSLSKAIKDGRAEAIELAGKHRFVMHLAVSR